MDTVSKLRGGFMKIAEGDEFKVGAGAISPLVSYLYRLVTGSPKKRKAKAWRPPSRSNPSYALGGALGGITGSALDNYSNSLQKPHRSFGQKPSFSPVQKRYLDHIRRQAAELLKYYGDKAPKGATIGVGKGVPNSVITNPSAVKTLPIIASAPGAEASPIISNSGGSKPVKTIQPPRKPAPAKRLPNPIHAAFTRPMSSIGKALNRTK